MKEHNGWTKLSTLDLNNTGLTDIGISYFSEASMPKLKTLNIEGNKFIDIGKYIDELNMNNIQVRYSTESERKM